MDRSSTGPLARSSPPVDPTAVFVREPERHATVPRQPCARALRAAELKVEIDRLYTDNRHVYGPRKVWRQLNREGIRISHCRTSA
jgi:hypothetical protein